MITYLRKKISDTATFRISFIRIIIYLCIIALTIGFFYYLGSSIRDNYLINQKTLTNFILQTGTDSWIIYIIIVAITALSPLPSTMLGLVAGYVFAPGVAIILTFIGEVVGASGNFFIGKYILKNTFSERRFPNIHKIIQKYKLYLNGRSIFILGLIPAGTANITGYTAGFVDIPYKTFIASWVSAVMILATIATYLGHSAKIKDIPLTILLGIVIILLLIFARRYTKTLRDRFLS